jgi:hypothetical protein
MPGQDILTLNPTNTYIIPKEVRTTVEAAPFIEAPKKPFVKPPLIRQNARSNIFEKKEKKQL